MEQEEIPHNRVKKRQGERKNILLVEDQVELAELYKEFLTPKYNVKITNTGADALKFADDDTDVVLLDRDLPDMNGGMVLHKLKNEMKIDARVAMLTGQEPDESILRLPVDDYQTKPIYENEIVALVETLLLRDLFVQVSEDMFRLTSKRSALQQVSKTHSEEYNSITDLISVRRDQIDEILDTINNNSIFRSFPK